MTPLTITLSEEHLLRLREKARRLGVTPEDMIRLSIADVLSLSDERKTADHVLTKNAELYRRLVAS